MANKEIKGGDGKGQKGLFSFTPVARIESHRYCISWRE